MRHPRALAAAVATATATILAAQSLAAPALAAEPALAAPGAPMRNMPEQAPPTLTIPTGDTLRVPPEVFAMTCTQGPNGTVRMPDGTSQRVMLTASHCVNTVPGNPPIKNEFMAPVGTRYVRLGERVASNYMKPEAMYLQDPMEAIRTADWGIVRLDDNVTATNLSQSRDWNGRSHGEPVRLTTIKDYRTLAPGEVSTDNFGEPICKDGATSGRSCATQIGRTRNGVYSWNLGYQHGDSGGVNFDPRDGSIIGVSSMTLGPLGKTQPADRIIEDAYGVPDGHVNEVFTVTDSSAPHANFTTAGEEADRLDKAVTELNPDFTPPVPREELRKAVGNAQADGARLADKAMRGQFDRAEVEQAVDHHTEQISFWGGAVLGQEVNKLLS